MYTMNIVENAFIKIKKVRLNNAKLVNKIQENQICILYIKVIVYLVMINNKMKNKQ